VNVTAEDTPSVCPTAPAVIEKLDRHLNDPWNFDVPGAVDEFAQYLGELGLAITVTPPPSGSPTPDTAALVERLRHAADTSDAGKGEWYQLIYRCREGADALEAQAARITALEQFLIRMGLRPDHLVP